MSVILAIATGDFAEESSMLIIVHLQDLIASGVDDDFGRQLVAIGRTESGVPICVCLLALPFFSYLSNTSNVEVAEAYKRPLVSVSLASANAALRPKDSVRPSARNKPVSFVIAL
jgi:hypothetical protein